MIEDRVRIPCGTLVRRSLIPIELDATSNGADGHHVLRGKFEKALAGADVQKGQTVSGLIDQDFGRKFSLVEFEESLKDCVSA
jgi:hypothetical protein